MASRKEQKEQLRREREERERQAKDAEHRKRIVGYAVGGGLVAAVVVVLLVLLVAGGGDGGGGEKAGDGDGAGLYPGGKSIPDPKVSDLKAAASAAGCEYKTFKADSRDHTTNPSEKVKYSSNPPTSGKHYLEPAQDGVYEKSPEATSLVHTMEHGRVIIWFRPSLPADQRGQLKTLFDEADFQVVLTPDNTNMPYAVAATAWNREPTPLGTGRLLGCKRFSDKVFDALRDFRDDNVSQGPESAP